ncbi:hypothetical protein J4440_02310 [Candidatus Woesearchaeota archaeon]|nr:hypothetical protein [Candidatus Woesearchaeota archaeon]
MQNNLEESLRSRRVSRIDSSVDTRNYLTAISMITMDMLSLRQFFVHLDLYSFADKGYLKHLGIEK